MTAEVVGELTGHEAGVGGRVSAVASDVGTEVQPTAATDGAAARLHALTAIATCAAGASRFDDVVELAAGAAQRALQAASVSISVWQRDLARVRVLINEGDLGHGEVHRPDDSTFPLTDFPFALPAFHEGRPVRFVLGDPPDAAGDQAAAEVFLRGLNQQSCMVLPILLEGRVWGELFAGRDHRQPDFTEADLDYAVAVSAQVAASIAQAEHLERVGRLAYTDALTGLANRRAIDDRLDQALDRHRSDGRTVSLIVVDVNGLKRINDGRGHAAGDQALIHFSGLLSLSAGLTPGSLAGRTGGDEFCIIIEGGTADGAVSAAHDLCRRANAGMEDGIACGVASTDDPVGTVDTPARLFRLADAAQARAKRSGCRSPVVAGRGMPLDATVALADAAEQDHLLEPEDRRQLRGAGSRSINRLVEDVLETLEHSAAASVQDRLEVVAGTIAGLIDVCSWWLSAATDDGTAVRTVRYSSLRLGLGNLVDPETVSGVSETYLLADYPVTRAVLAGGKAVVRVDDDEADPRERAVVEGAGAVALVMAGGHDRDGRGWLVEMFVDEVSGDVSALPTALRALTACALLTPPG